MEVWQKSRILVNGIYRATKNSLFSKDIVLCRQIHKAAISVSSNIAEGFERGGNREFLNFLSIVKGSTGELKSQLYIALDQGYADEADFKGLMKIVTDITYMIGGLMRYMNQSGMKGSKFKKG